MFLEDGGIQEGSGRGQRSKGNTGGRIETKNGEMMLALCSNVIPGGSQCAMRLPVSHGRREADDKNKSRGNN